MKVLTDTNVLYSALLYPKDASILNAAIIADVDIIISGDKHFHELTLSHPIVMSAFEFVKEYVAALNDEGQ